MSRSQVIRVIKVIKLQFYYVSVAVTLFRVPSTWYDVRDPHNF